MGGKKALWAQRLLDDPLLIMFGPLLCLPCPLLSKYLH